MNRKQSSERRVFAEQSRRHFATTGALAASSRALARAITSRVAPGDVPRRILEAGPGTGVFTLEIARRMGPLDRLDVYEINPAFSEFLEARLEKDPAFEKARGRIRLYRLDILDMPPDVAYDRIISSLPLNNFDPESVRTVFETFLSRLTAGGILSYFEYAFVRTLKGLISLGKERRRLRGVDRVTSEYLHRFQVRSEAVVLNLPPAVVRHLVRPAEARIPSPRLGTRLRPAAVVR